MNIPKRIYCDGAEVAYVFSVSGFFIALIAFISILSIVLTEPTIDSKIELYQSQNAEIESKIQATVASYLAHERQTYKDLTPDNAIAVVSAYPELHSNELVKKQIEVYEDNNKKILGLKEEKLNQSIYKWWLYFGK
ncbi:hypothetical protein HG470_001795 [Candidatus Saccharibacteria bacterium]|nr:hypothetical protein [Candidatus Saccharibacteria bacterium]